MEEKSTPIEPRKAMKPYFIVALTITVLLTGLAFALAAYSYTSDSPKVLNSSQVLAAIFSLVALSWIIVSFRQQQEALSQQHQALIQTQLGISKQLESDNLLKMIEYFFEERQRLRERASAILMSVAEFCLNDRVAPDGASEVSISDLEILRRKANAAMGAHGGSVDINPVTRLLELIRLLELFDLSGDHTVSSECSSFDYCYVALDRGLIRIITREWELEGQIVYDQDGIIPQFGRQLMPGLGLAISAYLLEAKALADFAKDEAQIHPLVAQFEKSDETKLAVVLAAYIHVMVRHSVAPDITLEDIYFEFWRTIGLEKYDTDIADWPTMQKIKGGEGSKDSRDLESAITKKPYEEHIDEETPF